ncbi:MAG TPA: TIGR03792 family protein [Thermoanaerobaculia bacterium]|nr:TIGR03792 family protein [Thermoanaerobaculia bacterium]
MVVHTVIEWQRVRVRPELRDSYVEKDAEIWTPELERAEGFLGKEVWLGEDGSEVVLLIRWRSREDWEGMPKDRLAELEERFRREVPDWEVVECRAYVPSSAG